MYIGTALIVAGGRVEDDKVLSTVVEVMNTENHQWSTTVELPESRYWISTTVYKDQIYMLGGLQLNKEDNPTTVSDLLQSCVSNSILAKSSKESIILWRQVADLATSFKFHLQVL